VFQNKEKQFMGFVYFIKELKKPCVKIGKSETRNGVDVRLADLQVGNARRLSLVGLIESEDFETLEKHIHNVWQSLKIRGEWFNFTKDQIGDILRAYNGLEIIQVESERPAVMLPAGFEEACRLKAIGYESLSVRELAKKYRVKKWRVDTTMKHYKQKMDEESAPSIVGIS
jgi:hypothetical protein